MAIRNGGAIKRPTRLSKAKLLLVLTILTFFALVVMGRLAHPGDAAFAPADAAAGADGPRGPTSTVVQGASLNARGGRSQRAEPRTTDYVPG